MNEQPFSIAIDGGVLHGHRGDGDGLPALLLHGGPGIPDYLDALAAELAPLCSTIRYTQRGTPPSSRVPPYSVETHMGDALAVLDAFEIERAWAVGHSWGGQLALHLAVAHPERLVGIVCIDPLGAFPVFDEYVANFRARIPADEWERVEALDERSEDRSLDAAERQRAGLECHHLLWPHYFADPASAGPDYLDRIGVECHDQTTDSVKAHFERGTLADGLPSCELRALFVHGAADPLPLRCSTETAALMPNASVELLPDCGHFPWLEQPDSVARQVGSLGLEAVER